MSDLETMELHELQGKADAASAMLNSAVFNEAFQMMNQGIVDQILATPPEATPSRSKDSENASTSTPTTTTTQASG